MPKPKYPDIVVKLVGSDGNAFAVLGRVQRALREKKVPELEIQEFFRDATSADYMHLLKVVNEWVSVL